MLDLHDLGLKQTGNESWARSIGAALLARDAGGYDIAVTSAAPAADLLRLPARTTALVSASSVRRLSIDLPRAMRRLRSSAVLVQYTVPASTTPAVVAVHDLSFEDPRATDWLGPARRMRYRATIRASVRRAAHVVALSQWTKHDLVRLYDIDPSRVTVAPAAVETGLAALLGHGPRRPRSGPAVVLSVGNVVPRKNLLVLARAVRSLRDLGRDVTLRVIGSVPRSGRATARELTDVLGDHVTIAGYVDQERLALAYRSADVFAFPSLYEGFGIPVVEAMTAGLPVVASDRTALPEVVADAGLVVPADDVSAWSDAITTALDPDEAVTLAERGRARARSFSWVKSAELVSRSLTFAASGPEAGLGSRRA